jgi:hypothetical protein
MAEEPAGRDDQDEQCEHCDQVDMAGIVFMMAGFPAH